MQDKTLIQKEGYIEDDIVRENFKFEKINLENVSFSYDKKKGKVFDNFNLEIKKGNYIGIVGSSGSGKSTLIDILTGLLNTSDGKIKLNNEIAEVGSVQWKQIFGYVTQSVNLFNDTIYANIAFQTDINKVK